LNISSYGLFYTGIATLRGEERKYCILEVVCLVDRDTQIETLNIKSY